MHDASPREAYWGRSAEPHGEAAFDQALVGRLTLVRTPGPLDDRGSVAVPPNEGEGDDDPKQAATRERLNRVLTALAAGDGATGTVPQRLCQAAVGLLAVSGAASSLLSQGRLGPLLCATDEVAARLEALQLTLGTGPGVDAHHHGRVVLAPDLAGASPDRWPAFTEGALTAGARAVFAFPLQLGAIRVGVLGLYRTTPGPLSDTGFGDGVILTDVATQAILAISARAPGGLEELIDPVALRAEVHQATGMVAAQLGVGIDEAYVRMQAHAYATGRLIGEVAAAIVARQLRLDAVQ